MCTLVIGIVNESMISQMRSVKNIRAIKKNLDHSSRGSCKSTVWNMPMTMITLQSHVSRFIRFIALHRWQGSVDRQTDWLGAVTKHKTTEIICYRVIKYLRITAYITSISIGLLLSLTPNHSHTCNVVKLNLFCITIKMY